MSAMIIRAQSNARAGSSTVIYLDERRDTVHNLATGGNKSVKEHLWRRYHRRRGRLEHRPHHTGIDLSRDRD